MDRVLRLMSTVQSGASVSPRELGPPFSCMRSVACVQLHVYDDGVRTTTARSAGPLLAIRFIGRSIVRVHRGWPPWASHAALATEERTVNVCANDHCEVCYDRAHGQAHTTWTNLRQHARARGG